MRRSRCTRRSHRGRHRRTRGPAGPPAPPVRVEDDEPAAADVEPADAAQIEPCGGQSLQRGPTTSTARRGGEQVELSASRDGRAPTRETTISDRGKCAQTGWFWARSVNRNEYDAAMRATGRFVADVSQVLIDIHRPC